MATPVSQHFLMLQQTYQLLLDIVANLPDWHLAADPRTTQIMKAAQVHVTNKGVTTLNATQQTSALEMAMGIEESRIQDQKRRGVVPSRLPPSAYTLPAFPAIPTAIPGPPPTPVFAIPPLLGREDGPLAEVRRLLTALHALDPHGNESIKERAASALENRNLSNELLGYLVDDLTRAIRAEGVLIRDVEAARGGDGGGGAGPASALPPLNLPRFIDMPSTTATATATTTATTVTPSGGRGSTTTTDMCKKRQREEPFTEYADEGDAQPPKSAAGITQRESSTAELTLASAVAMTTRTHTIRMYKERVYNKSTIRCLYYVTSEFNMFMRVTLKNVADISGLHELHAEEGLHNFLDRATTEVLYMFAELIAAKMQKTQMSNSGRKSYFETALVSASSEEWAIAAQFKRLINRNGRYVFKPMEELQVINPLNALESGVRYGLGYGL